MLQEVPPTFALRSYAKGVMKPRSTGITEVRHELIAVVQCRSPYTLKVKMQQRLTLLQWCLEFGNCCPAWLQVRGPYPDTYGKRAIWVGVSHTSICCIDHNMSEEVQAGG